MNRSCLAAAVLALAAAGAARAQEPSPGLDRDRILMVGMMPTGDEEAAALARVSQVVYARDSIRCLSMDDCSLVGREARRIKTFVESLGLEHRTQERLLRFLKRNEREDRDDWARLARLWAPAELGERIPSRFVLSGHSVGVGVYGDDGYLLFDALKELAAIMPLAASQIEDVFIAGCSAGSEETAAEMRRIFPNLKTYWAYAGVAPSPRTGSTEHLLAWERATRGDARLLDRGLAFGTARGMDVVTWSVDGGYQNGPFQRASAEWRRRLGASGRVIEPYFRGDRLVHADQALRKEIPRMLEQYYDLVDHLLKSGEHSAEQIERLEDARDWAGKRLERLEGKGLLK